jgi:hypothetical protein
MREGISGHDNVNKTPSSCFTQQVFPMYHSTKLVETAIGEEKSSSAKHGTNQVLGNGIYVCTRMYCNAMFEGC